MKKLITLFAASLMLFSATLSAQTIINAGYLHAVETTKYNNIKGSIPMNGFYVGLDYKMLRDADRFNFVPGVYYSLSTGSVHEQLLNETYRRTDHMLNVPLMGQYTVELSPVFSLFASLGPTLSLLIASSEKSQGSKTSVDLLENPVMKRFDIMVGGSVGVEFMDQFRISVGYDWGLLNRYKDLNSHRGQLRVGVSYLF